MASAYPGALDSFATNKTNATASSQMEVAAYDSVQL